MQTETDVKNACRLAIQEIGGVLWRNNVGALPDARGIPVRFGLANDSAQFNRVFKTGDLVGIMPEQWLPKGSLVPFTVGIFLMIECKEPGWKWSGTERERAQWEAIQFVRKMGGRAGFVTSPAQAVDVATGLSGGAYAG